jgi:cytoskeletal protein CcmA (bactofilin family)
MSGQANKKVREGTVLLVVLFIVMTVTVISLGFLWQSDVELACGQNMVLRAQMDCLAESGLEHAKGLILNPQDADSEYWTGAAGQQLGGGNDYYDVTVSRDESDANNRCNYIIDCNAYRVKAGEEIGCSRLRGELRLDPCIAYRVETEQTLAETVAIHGDVYCNGTLTNNGVVNGDVFATAVSSSIKGHRKDPNYLDNLQFGWPAVSIGDFTSHYNVEPISPNLSDITYGPYNPVRICYYSGDVSLEGNVEINGMLAIEGDLRITGTGNVIEAGKNVPALFVTGDLIVDTGGQLAIEGLAVVEGKVQVSGGAGAVNITGSLFTRNGLCETTADSSGNSHPAIKVNNPMWRPAGGHTGGAVEFDGTDDKLEVPDAGSFLNGLGAITVSMWVKSDVTGRDRGILSSREPSGNDEELGIRYDEDGAFGGGVNGIKASIRTTSGYAQIESSSNVQTKDWQHLALVWQSGEHLKLYINGQLNSPIYDTGALSGALGNIEKLTIGRDTKSKYWDGLIDDLRIYNRVLAPGDIYPPKEGLSGLIGHWRLDEQGSDRITITAEPARAAIEIWSGGSVVNWGPAAGAFFRSIERR